MWDENTPGSPGTFVIVDEASAFSSEAFPPASFPDVLSPEEEVALLGAMNRYLSPENVVVVRTAFHGRGLSELLEDELSPEETDVANFSVKHYAPIANMLKEEIVKQVREFNGLGGKAIEDLAYRMAEHFEADNRNFSRVKFLEAAIPPKGY